MTPIPDEELRRLVDTTAIRSADLSLPAPTVHALAAELLACREALGCLLSGYDAERGIIDASPDAGCIECTFGATPHEWDTGPCGLHQARALLPERQKP